MGKGLRLVNRHQFFPLVSAFLRRLRCDCSERAFPPVFGKECCRSRGQARSGHFPYFLCKTALWRSGEIGRASCRERVERAVGAGAVNRRAEESTTRDDKRRGQRSTT